MSSPTPRCPTVVSESAAIDEKPTFLNIPAEIRLKIYDHIWTNVEYHVEKNKVPWRRSGATRLDLVCKKLRKECAMRMVSEAIFNLAPTAEHRRCRWLTLVATPILYKENIRHIKMADNHFFRLGNQTLKPLTMLALIEIKISDLLMWRQQVEELTPKGLVQKVLNPYIVNDCGDHVRKKVADHVDVKVEGYVSVVCSIRKGFVSVVEGHI